MAPSKSPLVMVPPFPYTPLDKVTRQPLLQGPAKGGLYEFAAATETHATTSSPEVHHTSRLAPSSDLWHARLGHPSAQLTAHVISSFHLPKISGPQAHSPCTACSWAETHALPHPPTPTRSTKVLELLFLDVWGPAHKPSIKGNLYYLSVVDDFSKFIWFIPMPSKSNVTLLVTNLIKLLTNHFSTNVISVQTDGGTEFKPLRHLFADLGIFHRLTCPYSHQQNGTVETRHRRIVDSGLTLLKYANLPLHFWDYAFETAAYLINRLPTPVLQNTSPFEQLFHKSPDYKFLRAFGCLCFPNLRPYLAHKLNFRSTPCIFLGYSPNHKGYICFDWVSNRTYISRDVAFHETTFPYTLPPPSPTETHTPLPSIPILLQHGQPTTSPSNPISPQPPLPSTISHLPNLGLSPAAHITSPPNPPYLPTPQSAHSLPTAAIPLAEPIAPTEPLGTAPPHPMVTRSRDHITCPLVRTDGTIPWPSASTAVTIPDEPFTYAQASKHAEWRAAMNLEFHALQTTKTWTLVPPPSNCNILGVKWVYKTKRHSDGRIERRKARLVAKGYHQMEGIDFTETFSPVAKPTTIRLLLSLACMSRWSVRQLDIQNAFLHGDLNEEAPRAWFSKLSSALITMGFSASRADTSLFVYSFKSQVVYVLVYVDDLLVVASDPTLADQFIAHLSGQFPVKDLGAVHYFLGVEINRTDEAFHLCQKKYITDLLSKLQMTTAKSVATPMATSFHDLEADSPSFDDQALYRSVVGSLQYLAFTRPDLSFAVNKVCQYMHHPRQVHWQAVKRILRYLVGTVDHTLVLSASAAPFLSAFSDADWAGDQSDRRSTGAYCVFLGCNLISWSSRKQTTVSRSSTEAEYRAVAHATCEVLFIQSLLAELKVSLARPPVLWCDNLGATYIASNPVLHHRIKHLSIDYHFVRERVQAKSLEVVFVSSKDQVADLLTKPLAADRFHYIRSKLCLRSFGSRGNTKDTDMVNNEDNVALDNKVA